jgi:hypothetical protein
MVLVPLCMGAIVLVLVLVLALAIEREYKSG